MTHGVHWLPSVDKIVVMTQGEISDYGSYEELMSRDGVFAQFLKSYLLKEESEEEDEDEESKHKQSILFALVYMG